MASLTGGGLGSSGGMRRGSSTYLNDSQYDDSYNQSYETPKTMSAAAAKMERRRRGEVRRAPEPSAERYGMSSATSMPSLFDGGMKVRHSSSNPYLSELGSMRDLSQTNRGSNGSTQDLRSRNGSVHRSMNDVSNLGGSRRDLRSSSQDVNRSRNDLQRSWQDLNSMSGSRRDVFGSSQDVNGMNRSRTDLRQSTQDVNAVNRSRQDIYRSSQDVSRSTSSSRHDVSQDPTHMYKSMYDLHRVGRSQDRGQRNNDAPGVHRSTQDLRRGWDGAKNQQNEISRSVLDVRNLSSGRSDMHKSWNDVRGHDKNISRSAGNIDRGVYGIASGQSKDPNTADGSQRDLAKTPSQSVASMSSSASQGPKPPARRGFYNSRRGRKGATMSNRNNASATSIPASTGGAGGTSPTASGYSGSGASSTPQIYKTTTASEPKARQTSSYIDDQADRFQNGVPMRKEKKAAAPPKPVNVVRPMLPSRPQETVQTYANLSQMSQDMRQSYNSVYGEATAGHTFQVEAEVVPQSLRRSMASLDSEPRSTSSTNQLEHSDSIMDISEEYNASNSHGNMTPAASVTTLAFSELDDDDNKALLGKAISTWSLLSNGALVPGLPFRTTGFVFPVANLILMSIAAIFVTLGIGDVYWFESKDRKWWFGQDGMFNGECVGNPSSSDDGMAKGAFAMVVLSFIAQIGTFVGMIFNFTLSQGYIKFYTVPRLEKWSITASAVCAGISAFLLIVAASMFGSLDVVTSDSSVTDSFILAIMAIITLVASVGVLGWVIFRQRKRL